VGPRLDLTDRRITLVLVSLTLLVLVLAAPAALVDDLKRGQFYLFTSDFLNDIPKRLTGPGRFRFILQPSMAIFLGWRDGIADARAGRTPYLMALLLGRGGRAAVARSGLATIANLLAMGILLDAVFQWVILGRAYPGPALVVGPVLIGGPYALARALTNRAVRASGRSE
jgi:hypothetical protein